MVWCQRFCFEQTICFPVLWQNEIETFFLHWRIRIWGTLEKVKVLMLDVAPSISESRYFFFRMAINVFESLAYLLFLFVCLDANSRKTDTKWIAIIITVFIISYYVIHCQIYTWEFFLKAVIIRLVTFVKKESFRGLSTRIFSCFFPCQPPYILIFHFYHVIYENICDEY